MLGAEEGGGAGGVNDEGLKLGGVKLDGAELFGGVGGAGGVGDGGGCCQEAELGGGGCEVKVACGGSEKRGTLLISLHWGQRALVPAALSGQRSRLLQDLQ